LVLGTHARSASATAFVGSFARDLLADTDCDVLIAHMDQNSWHTSRYFFVPAPAKRLLHGAQQLADAVRVTLGPRSKSVLIQKKWGVPLVCNDGVTIAKETDLPDAEENLGAQMLRQAAEKTGEVVGDGTSTATILVHALFADGVRNVVGGASAIENQARP
jgi:chaperonin GroEL